MGASWLGVPIMSGSDPIGVVAFIDQREHAFSEADERLVSTIVANMGVALENARLFDETKRLLAETEQRSAELAVINDIGTALARQLDFQAIVELVGDASRLDLQVQGHLHRPLRPGRQPDLTSRTSSMTGKRVYSEPIRAGSRAVQSRSCAPAGRCGSERSRSRTPTARSPPIYRDGYVGTMGESWLGVPIMVRRRGGRPGRVRADEPHAFSEADERLVSTIVTNMGVALENARLFDETKHLLAETDERAAELAIINSVQQGLAGKLDMQAMYELVGDKIQEIFDAQVVDIGVLDREAGLIRFPYTIERGVRFPDEPIAIIGFRRIVFESKEPLLVNRDTVRLRDRGRPVRRHPGRAAEGLALRPADERRRGDRRHLAPEPRPRGRLHRNRRAPPHDARRQPERGARERPACSMRRSASSTETDERAAELAIINSVQQGLAAQARDAGDVRPRRRQDPGDLRRPESSASASSTAARACSASRTPSSAACANPIDPIEVVGFRQHVLETGEPLLDLGRHREVAARVRQAGRASTGEVPKARSFVPLDGRRRR